jgi:hypothetical protein
MASSRRMRSLCRAIGVMLAVVLLTPVTTAGAAVLDDVVHGAVPVGTPDWRSITASWTPFFGNDPSVPRAASRLRLDLPAELHELAGTGTGTVMVDADVPEPGYGLTTEGFRLEAWDLVVDLPRVLAAVRAGNPEPPSELRLSVRTVGSTTDSFVATVLLRLTDGPAVPDAVVTLPKPVPTAAWSDRRYYHHGPLVLASGGVTVVLEAVPGFWDDVLSVDWLDYVGQDVGREDLRAHTEISPDGDVLAVWIPDTLPVGNAVDIVARDPDGAESTVRVRLWTPSSDPVQAYVQTVYADLFGREPDPQGLLSWAGALRRGTPYGAVADGITYSAEFRAGLVAEAYVAYLDREPDLGGLLSWVEAMERGLHIQQMEAGFLASPEYFAASGGTDQGWVGELYRDVLGREAGAAEVAGWLPVVRSAGRVAVARQFLYSTEHLTTVVDGYYRWLLGRGIDPTGQRGWVSAIQAGHRSEAIIAGIIASPEYRANVPVS